MALPEVDKLLMLSMIFNVSIDVLLKEELTLSDVAEIHSCGSNAVKEQVDSLYKGTLIKESVDDDSIIDYMTIHKVELWNTGGKPKYWTVLHFTSTNKNFPERISQVLIADEAKGGNWFVDFKSGNIKYIVFRNLVLKYSIGNEVEKSAVCKRCRELGITDTEMQWSE